MKIRFIGDIHGKYAQYLSLIRSGIDTVQIGDFGVGFGPDGRSEFIDNMISSFGSPGFSHRFIRGNHDDPNEAKKSLHYIPDGTVEGPIMYIGGASSIDREWRTAGIDWWPDEELSYPELEELIASYETVKPDILVTHECPEFFAREAMIPLVNGFINFPSKTRQALDVMYAIHPPKIHIFGHWHKALDYIYPGTETRFICLNELEYIDMEV
jgi:hypothetical protein